MTYLLYASRSFGTIASHFTLPNNHILHTMLVRISTLLFGDSPIALRLPALAFGIALIPLAYATGRVLYKDRLGALLGSALVGASAMLIEYSTQARGYSMIGVCFLGAACLVPRLARGTNVAEWTLFVLCIALGFATSLVMLYPCAALFAWLGASGLASEKKARRRFAARFAAALTAAAVLSIAAYLPSYVYVGREMIDSIRHFSRPMPVGEFLTSLPAFLARVWRSWHRDIPLVAALIFTGLVGVSLTSHRRLAAAGHRVPFLPVALCATIALVTLQRVLPFLRVWQFLLPLWLLTAAAAFGLLRTAKVRSFAAGAGAMLCGVLALIVTQSYHLPFDQLGEGRTLRDIEPVLLALREELKPGDGLLSPFPNDVQTEYYVRRAGIDPQILNREPKRRFRLYVLVDLQDGLEETLKRASIDLATFGNAKVMAETEYTALVMLERK